MESLVQWHEGMLISPQHFQLTTGYFQQAIGYVSASIFPFGYGLFDLKIDTSCLASGLIRVLKAKGFFPDGLFFDFDAVRDDPLELNLGDYFSINSSATKIFLAVPSRRSGENMLEGDLARYMSSEITDVKDENTGKEPISVPILKPNLKLFQEFQVDARYQRFPIFEVEKSTEGGVVGTEFLYPLLALDEHSKIVEMCSTLVRIIRDKISYFADRKGNFARNQTEESLSNLRLLIQAVIPLETVLKINGLHPFELFKALSQTAAFVMSVNPAQLIPKLPVYDHENLYNCFNQLCEYVHGIVSHLKQKYDVILFEKIQDEFRLMMHPDWLEKDEIAIGIRKPFSATENDIINWIGGVQIASESMMPLIKDRRVLGAERRILERGEYITQPNGVTIISVKTQTTYIKANEHLCLTSSNFDVIPEEIIFYAERE